MRHPAAQRGDARVAQPGRDRRQHAQQRVRRGHAGFGAQGHEREPGDRAAQYGERARLREAPPRQRGAGGQRDGRDTQAHQRRDADPDVLDADEVQRLVRAEAGAGDRQRHRMLAQRCAGRGEPAAAEHERDHHRGDQHPVEADRERVETGAFGDDPDDDAGGPPEHRAAADRQQPGARPHARGNGHWRTLASRVQVVSPRRRREKIVSAKMETRARAERTPR